MLFLAQRNLQISASYILCGISQNDSIDHHFHIPSPKKGDQTFRDEPVFTQIEQAYDHREQLWQVPSINPRSFKKTPCIYHEQKLMRYLSSRGDTSFLDPDDYEYLNGDPIEINLVCFSDYFLGLQPGQKLFLSLMSDPFWFWPDPTYYYIITFREDWAVGSIVLSGDIHQLIIHTLNQSDVVLRRNEITSIWRLERWGI
jgi:hypothetical protein